MKTIQKISISLMLVILLSIQIRAQQSKIDFESLQVGRSYKVLTFNGWETEGELVKIDSSSLEVKSEYKIFTIPKSQIKDIKNGSPEFNKIEPISKTYYYNSKFKNDKTYLSLGSGIIFAPNYSGYNKGINIQLNVMKIMSPGYAIRGDFQYSHNPANNEDYYYYKREGGNLNSYGIKFDFLLGNFRSESKINGYGILGGGLNILKETDRKTSYPEYDYTLGEYTGNTISYTSSRKAEEFFNVDLGGGLSYKISDKVKLYGEAEYSFPFAILFYGFFLGTPSLKVGTQIEF